MLWQLKKNTVKDFTEPNWQLWKNGQLFGEYIRNGKRIRNKNHEWNNNCATSPASSMKQSLHAYMTY